VAEERITEVETPTGDTHTTHTIVTDGEPRSGGGSGWLIAIVLIIAVIAGIWFFSGMSNSESAKDNAIANAADNVGSAAKQVGNAAENAADSVTNNK
jgi:flagellar basal body-associated protein FliL